MAEQFHVHFTHPPDEQSIALLRSLLDPCLCVSSGETIPDTEGLHYLVSGRPSQEQIESCPSLMAVIIPFAGVPQATRELLQNYPHISIHNLHHNALPVAENALALLLAAAKQIIPPHNALKENDWRPRYGANTSILLHGRTALLLGYGYIGRHLAKVLSSLGMKIMAIRNSLGAVENDDYAEIHPSSDLHALLPHTDVLICSLPLTPATDGLISEQELGLLPQGAIVVNVGRGRVIDQAAFYVALKNAHLGAAGIDVWYNYPEEEASRTDTPPADFPFNALENVVLSPHRAGGLHSADTERLRIEHLAELLNHAARGEALPNRVDLGRGY